MGKKSMKEVVEFLNIGGMSSNNPYNFVRQGTITNLATSSSKSRLQILRQVAGISTYEENKALSETKLEDTSKLMIDIGEKISGLNDSILKLQQQEADLKKFKSLEEKHKELKYAILSQECEEKYTKITAKQKEMELEKEKERKQIKRRHEISNSLTVVNKKSAEIEQQELILGKRNDEYQKQIDSITKDLNSKLLLVSDKKSQIIYLEDQINEDERLNATEEKSLNPKKNSFEQIDIKLKKKEEEILTAKNELELLEERR